MSDAQRPGEDPNRPQPQEIRFYGTTWVDHSGGYTARRLGLALAALALAAVGAFVLRFAYEGLALADVGGWASIGIVVVFALCSSMAFSRTLGAFTRRPEGQADEARERSMRSILLIGFIGYLLAYALRSLVEAPGEKLLRGEYDAAVELRASAPDVPLVRADGNALPFADAALDLVTFAQSWHWTRPEDSVAQALRVLRPGGALALWWNLPDPEVAWAREQERRLARALPGYHHTSITGDAPQILRRLGHRPATRTVRWQRPVSLKAHLAHLGSHSYLAAQAPERSRAVLEAEREALLAHFPDGRLSEPYVLKLYVVIRGG